MRVVIAGDYPETPPSLVGGIQAVIYNTLEYLAGYGDLDLHVVTCEKWRSGRLRGAVTGGGGRGGWTVHYLPSSPAIPHTVSMLTVDRRAIRRAIERLRPDLVHAHGQTAAYPFAAFRAGRPTLVTVHGLSRQEAQVDQRGGALKSRLRIALWASMERQCLARARDIVIISPFVRRMIEPLPRARLHAIENPVHDDFFRLRPAPSPGQVLMVGTVRRAKGTLEAVKAMALVHRRVPGARLNIAGNYTHPFRQYGAQVQQLLAETGAGEYVHVLGYLEHEALLKAYHSSQVFLLPSWQESSPVALAQAMAAGLPSVVSDIGGTEHLVEEGRAGYRVPPGDVQGLADRILSLLEDEAERRRMGQQAREIAEERFRQEQAARKTHELYLALAGGA